MAVDEDSDIVVAVEQEPEVVSKEAPAVAAKVEVETPAAPADDLAEQFKGMQAQAEAERVRREASERAAREAQQDALRARAEAAQARTHAADSQYGTVVSGLEAAEAEARSAEHEYKVAFEGGDAAAMATAQRKIARAEAKIARLDEAKADIEARRTADSEKPVTEAPTRTAPSDPVEAYIAGRTEPTANWLRDHKEWITDPKKNSKLTAAHFDAVGEGLSADTPEYFTHVETFLGLRKTEPAKTNGHAKPVQRKQSVPVAPVQASGNGMNGGGTEVRLTASEARAATDGTVVHNAPDPTGKNRWKVGDPVGVQEYARRKYEMQKQGLYDKSYSEA